MSIPDVLIIIAVVFFAVEEIEARGRAVGWWGAIILGVALLWGHFT